MFFFFQFLVEKITTKAILYKHLSLKYMREATREIDY